jgi:nucleoside 2-deoxyribosyltransferase
VKLLYVAGPVRNASIWERHQNILRGEQVAVELWKMGFAVHCPHKNTEFVDGTVSDDQIIAADLEIISRCDGIVIIPNWVASIGTMKERKFAYEQRIPVFYWERELDRLHLKQWVHDEYDLVQHMIDQLKTYSKELSGEEAERLWCSIRSKAVFAAPRRT